MNNFGTGGGNFHSSSSFSSSSTSNVDGHTGGRRTSVKSSTQTM